MGRQLLVIQDAGYLESAQWLEATIHRWDQKQLLTAAEAAMLRNTGWPIGVVLTSPANRDFAPQVTPEGIEVRIDNRLERDFDYWTLTRDGRFYFLRTFEEDRKAEKTGGAQTRPGRVLWWDVRLWRITEALLHSAVLYRELGIPADTPYLLTINHEGLANREFSVSRPTRYLTSGGSFCKVASCSWLKKVTQDVVVGGLKELVAEVCRELFVLFNFQEVPRTTIDRVVDEFLQSRV